MQPFPMSWQGYTLRWIDEDRTGRARTDWSSRGHILNPYYYRDGFVWCACRLCEPHLWFRWPLHWLEDENSFLEPPRAKNGKGWPDLDEAFWERFNQFTPLRYYGGKFTPKAFNAQNPRLVKGAVAR